MRNDLIEMSQNILTNSNGYIYLIPIHLTCVVKNSRAKSLAIG